jgi:hypothetical protein
MKLWRILLIIIAITAVAAGCSSDDEPKTPTPIPEFLPLELQLKPSPTPYGPPPTAIPVELQAIASRDPVIDPVSDLVPTVDPQIVSLLESVSEQNLRSTIQTLENFGTRHSYSDTESDTAGIGATRRWLFDEFRRVGGDRLDVQFQDYEFTLQGKKSAQRNIISTLPGTGERAGVLVLMANYDSRNYDWLDGKSIAPGADDNASGVAALLEIARLMSAREWDQTVVFAALTAEEQGTFGSRHFVERALANNLLIDAAINNDMIGGREGIPQSVRLFSVGPDTSQERQLARYIDTIGRLYLPNFPVEMIDGLDREGRWGDQREFVNAGYTAVRLIESEEDLSIQNSRRDTWSLIDYGYLRQVVQLNLATLANMACAPPPASIAEPVSAPGSFLVAWVPEPQVQGYAISVRPLGSDRHSQFRYVSAEQAGNVILSGFESQGGYAISIATINDRGCLGAFSSPEIILRPTS